MLELALVLNPLLMLALPIGLGLFLSRRLGTPWRLFFVGGATFILSQLVHLPLNAGLTWLFNQPGAPQPPAAYRLLFNVTVLGLTAGLCEELARYLVLRYWLKSARAWREALMFGAGHGGIEAILLAGLAGLTTINLLVLRRTDLGTLPLSAGQLAQVQQQLASVAGLPWFYPFLGTVERVFALATHLALAVLVVQALARRNRLWLLAAIVWHAFTNGLVVYVLQAAGPYWSEIALAGTVVVDLAIISLLRQPGPPAPAEAASAAPPLPMPDPAPLAPPALTPEALEKTRYQ